MFIVTRGASWGYPVPNPDAMEASKQQESTAERMLVSSQRRASTGLPLWNQTQCSDKNSVHSYDNKYPPVMYAMRFAELVVWMWIGYAHERCSWYLKVLAQITANKSWEFCHRVNYLCSPSVQRHYDWGLICIFIYLSTIFDCVSCVASSDYMKMRAEKQRLLKDCLTAILAFTWRG